MANPNPFVAVACVCERVLIEKDEVVSIIRIADNFTLTIPPQVPEEFKPHVSMQLLVSLRAMPFGNWVM